MGSPKALITFNYRFRWEGKQQRIKLGRYRCLKLIDARKKVNVYRHNLDEGLDPKAGKMKVEATGYLVICVNFQRTLAITML